LKEKDNLNEVVFVLFTERDLRVYLDATKNELP